jgi:DNA-binding CsgD family transcriptional regulator
MKTDPRSAASAFVNLFPPQESPRPQYTQFRAEMDKEVILRHLHFTEQIFPHCAIMLCPVSHSTIKYMSPNCDTVIGQSHRLLEKLDLPDFFAMIHPDDLPTVTQCFEFIRGCEPYDPAAHRFSLDYRFKNQHGEYAYIKNENIAVKTDHDSYLYMILIESLEGQEKFHQVKLDIFRKMKTAFVKVHTYNPRQKHEITPRQNDIAHYIVKGFSNKEIADKLKVSVFTVKNHKQLLFKKMNVKNSMELASQVRAGNSDNV